jgi:hypothetical protein
LEPQGIRVSHHVHAIETLFFIADNCPKLSDTEVQVKISGAAGNHSYTLTAEQISASPSVFATAIENSDDPASAITNIDLSKYRLTFDHERSISAF